MLPDELELVSREADSLLDTWLCDVPPEEIIIDEDDVVQEHWYLLL